MFGLAAITKLAKGGAGPQQLATLFEAMGMTVNMEQLREDQRQAAFQRAARAAVAPDANVLSISGQDKDGQKIEAILVVAPCHNAQ